MNLLRQSLLITAFLGPVLASSPLRAASVSDRVSINLSGTVIATASCTFSDANPIQVEFGDVYENEIDRGIYQQPMPWQVTCKGDPDGKMIQMRVSGTVASFNGNNLKTSESGLSIKLLKGSAPLMLNQWFDLDTNNPPQLNAVLEKASGARFQDGQTFNTTATLEVAYN
ncbi:fimbrial protein [Salmonella enterica]